MQLVGHVDERGGDGVAYDGAGDGEGGAVVYY